MVFRVLAVWMLLSAIVYAQDFTSSEAKDANGEYKSAIEKLNTEYERLVRELEENHKSQSLKLRKSYVTRLRSVRSVLLEKDDLDEALRVVVEIKAVERRGAFPPRGKREKALEAEIAELRAQLTGTRIVLWNQHNGSHNDRGTAQCTVVLSRENKRVWQSDVNLDWAEGKATSRTITPPVEEFDRVRVHITKWHGYSGGLSEIEVIRGQTNIARNAPVKTSANFDSRFDATKVIDGITDSNTDYVGYWILPNNSPGWVEVDLSHRTP